MLEIDAFRKISRRTGRPVAATSSCEMLPEDLRAIVIALRNILDATHEDDIVNLNAVDIARQLERAMRRQYGEG